MLTMILAELRRGRNRDALELAARLVAENDALRVEVAKLRIENRNLRRRLADRELAKVRRAHADALFVGALAFAQLPTSRAACLGYGLSRRRWAWAVALLQVAHVRTQAGTWADVSVEGLEAALRGAVGRVEADGVGLLAARMGRNGYSGRHVTHPRTVTRTVTRDAQNVTINRVHPQPAQGPGQGGDHAKSG